MVVRAWKKCWVRPLLQILTRLTGMHPAVWERTDKRGEVSQLEVPGYNQEIGYAIEQLFYNRDVRGDDLTWDRVWLYLEGHRRLLGEASSKGDPNSFAKQFVRQRCHMQDQTLVVYANTYADAQEMARGICLLTGLPVQIRQRKSDQQFPFQVEAEKCPHGIGAHVAWHLTDHAPGRRKRWSQVSWSDAWILLGEL